MTYRAMSERADRIRDMIRERAREACRTAGLDPSLLGIHPHNAMVDYSAGRPWRGVDYSKVRLSLRLQRLQWAPSDVVARWYKRQPPERMGELFARAA